MLRGVGLCPLVALISAPFDPGSEVDPGSIASDGIDGKDNSLWTVDQRVTYQEVSGRMDTLLLDGFFCGGTAGKMGNGPKTKLLAVERKGKWEEVSPDENNDRGGKTSPFSDPSITRFIARIDGVKPLQGLKAIMPAATFEVMVDTRQSLRGEKESEMTLHFLNPDNKSGPFPGTTDGAVRFRTLRNPDGSVTFEGYYVTRAAREYIDALTDFVPLAQTGKSLFSLGKTFFRYTPVGFFTSPVTDALGRTLEGFADRAIDATGLTKSAAATLHARYYRNVLFPNVLGK